MIARHVHPLVEVACRLATRDQLSQVTFDPRAIECLEDLLLAEETLPTLPVAMMGLYSLAHGLFAEGSLEGSDALIRMLGRIGPKAIGRFTPSHAMQPTDQPAEKQQRRRIRVE